MQTRGDDVSAVRRVSSKDLVVVQEAHLRARPRGGSGSEAAKKLIVAPCATIHIDRHCERARGQRQRHWSVPSTPAYMAGQDC